MSNTPEPVSRNDLRASIAWIVARPARRFLVASFLLIAGIASVLGRLRWEQAFARWSFAILMAALAAIVILWPSGRREKRD